MSSWRPAISIPKSKSAAVVIIAIAPIFSAHAQLSTMREAILIQGWLDKFEAVNSECQEIQRKDPGWQPDVARHFQNIKNACSAARYGQHPIPEDIQVDNYKTLNGARDCLVQIASELVKGGEGRIRIDATPTLRDDEKQVLRKRLGEPITDLLQRCKAPLDKFDVLRRSVRAANGKGALE